MATRSIPLSAVRVGKRHRKDLGDIRSLARSIQEIGLLHPVVIRPDGKLIAGERRLRALKLLGWTKVPVTVLDLDKVIRGEVAENVFRQDFRPSEMVAIARALEPILRREAKARQGMRTDLRENFPDVDGGRARDKLGKYVGVSGRTLEKMMAIVEAAEKHPRKFGHLKDEMDRKGPVALIVSCCASKTKNAFSDFIRSRQNSGRSSSTHLGNMTRHWAGGNGRPTLP
jgi:ParB-like chromosome segregation protein Spo0J